MSRRPRGPRTPSGSAGSTGPRAGDPADPLPARELGCRPAVEFSEGLAATVAWYRDNRAWWEPLESAPRT